MATVRDLITAALQELGAKQPSEVSDAAEAEDSRLVLNRMIDQWAAERLQIYQIVRTTWTITTNVGTYTVGTGGTVNVARPVFVDHVNFIDTAPTPDIELQLNKLTENGYAGLAVKSLTGVIPSDWYYTPTYPLGTLILWPTPTSSTLQGVLYAPQAVAVFAAISDVVALPPGYEELIVTNLAVALSPSWSRPVDPSLRERAVNAKAIVKRANKRLTDMSFPADGLIGGGAWSIYEGP